MHFDFFQRENSKNFRNTQVLTCRFTYDIIHIFPLANFFLDNFLENADKNALIFSSDMCAMHISHHLCDECGFISSPGCLY